MKVASAKEFLWIFENQKEIPEFDLENESDEVLANTLMQIRLDIMEESHYVPLAKVILERHANYGAPAGFRPTKYLVTEMEKSATRLINLAISLDMALTEEMILYYAAKSCEEKAIGDMSAGTDNYDDDWYIHQLYHMLLTKSKLFNLFQLTKEQELMMINAAIEKLVPQRDKIQSELNNLYTRKTKLEA